MKTCPECGKVMQPFLSGHNPPASEWYCEDCHKSIYMTTQERTEVVRMLAQPPAQPKE